jgi:hypothetical protein
MNRRLLNALVCLGLAAMPACGWPLGPRPTRPFFTDFRPFNDPRPPQEGLVLWIEGDALTGDPTGRVAAWPDMRPSTGGLRAWRAADGTIQAGTIVATTLRTPVGLSRSARALRCATGPRCSYTLNDAAGAIRRDLLTGRPYAILAVVRRAGARGDNYVVMTEGLGCIPSAGGTGCTTNTALHLGWSGERTLRLGHYDNDAVIDDVPAFNAAAPALSILLGRLNVAGKTAALLEPLYDSSRMTADTRALDRSGTVFVGGTPWVDANAVPDWRFEGDIFAVLIYATEITDAQLQGAADYLRTRYGPR